MALQPQLDDHSSGTLVAKRFTQPTRVAGRNGPDARRHHATPIRFCSRWGLPCRLRCRRRGALLPHRFTRAEMNPAVCFLWHFPWGCPRRTLSGTVIPWSPDFPLRPPFDIGNSGHPASWHLAVRRFISLGQQHLQFRVDAPSIAVAISSGELGGPRVTSYFVCCRYCKNPAQAEAHCLGNRHSVAHPFHQNPLWSRSADGACPRSG